MQTFQGAFMVIERDDAVLIPGEPPSSEFNPVTVQLDDGVSVDDINGEGVALLQSRDGNTLRFVRCDPAQWEENYERWEKAGWDPIGFESVRFYPSYQEYAASTIE